MYHWLPTSTQSCFLNLGKPLLTRQCITGCLPLKKLINQPIVYIIRYDLFYKKFNKILTLTVRKTDFKKIDTK